MKWTKIDQLALGIKFIGEPFNFSSYRVALMKIEIVKKNCSLQGNERKLFSDVNIIWLYTQSDRILQQLNSTNFWVPSVTGRGGYTWHIQTYYYFGTSKNCYWYVSIKWPKYNSIVPKRVPIPYPPYLKLVLCA